MARSPEPAAWVPGHKPVYGLLTHSSAGGLFPNMLKRAGFDQVVIDGRADRPVRLEAVEGRLRIVDAEDDLFETAAGRRVPRAASVITDLLAARVKGGSTLTAGPAGWNLVDFACLTADRHRNFGRGGAGAVFGSKNLVAITAFGQAPVAFDDAGGLQDARPRARRPDQGQRRRSRPGRPPSGRRPARPGGSTGPSTAATSGPRAAICPGTISTRARSTRPTTPRSRPTPSWPSPASTASATSAGTSSARARPRSRRAPTRARACARSSRRSPSGSTAASSTATPSST